MSSELALKSGEEIKQCYRQVRARTSELCTPLAVEDYCIQSMTDASPTKWHLGHTSWFFENFLLATRHKIVGGQAGQQDYAWFHPRYPYLFNSYYNTVGKQHTRAERGLLSRPTLEEVGNYRSAVDDQMQQFLELPERLDEKIRFVVELGIHHEQQHQELILADLQHLFFCNPLRPAYQAEMLPGGAKVPPLDWLVYPGGEDWIGHDGKQFAFDNETPRHAVLLEPFALASRLVTNSEYLAFIKDDGYQRPELWLSDGWIAIQENRWQAPLYWERSETGAWWRMSLSGMQRVEPAAPVTHVSYYEAEAFARWAGARLPTEAEWETAAAHCPVEGNFVESGALEPVPFLADVSGKTPAQMFGDVWEWTASPYAPYPGFKPLAGSFGEYNGKFMCNQIVLRGGSCVSPQSHLRPTYRNFFHPDKRWQFSGFRLAKDA